MRALVTGANRGIGLATAQGLAALGLEVVLGCRDAAGGEAAAAGIPGSTFLPLDLADGASVAWALAALGPLDVLVNNAGVCPEGTTLQVAPEAVRQAFEVHVFGPLALIRGVLPGMLARGYGRIVNLSSGWGSFGEGLSGPFAYAVSKAALDALTFSISHELSGDVKINACCPGWVATRMGGPGATLTPEKGASTPIWLATLPPDGPNGGFFRNRKPIPW